MARKSTIATLCAVAASKFDRNRYTLRPDHLPVSGEARLQVLCLLAWARASLQRCGNDARRSRA